MTFLPKFFTKVLLASVPDREILKVNFVVPGTITWFSLILNENFFFPQ